jgi:hypothetical protein
MDHETIRMNEELHGMRDGNLERAAGIPLNEIVSGKRDLYEVIVI